MSSINQDIALQFGIAVVAVAALCLFRPRWDTGHGALMILVLGLLGIPVWAPLLMLYFAVFLVRMGMVAVWWSLLLPAWWISRPLFRKFYSSFRHRKGDPIDPFRTES